MVRLAISATLFDTLKEKSRNTFVGVKATKDSQKIGQQDDRGRWKQLEEQSPEHE